MPPTSTKPRRRPVQERSRLTVEAILEAAAQVFEGRGYAAGTTNRIADRAGVSIGTLYQYFTDKDSILTELASAHVAQGSEAIGSALETLARESPPLDDGLELLVDGMVGLHRERPRLHRVLFQESPRPPELQEHLEGLAAAAREAIGAWLEARPEVKVRDTDTAAALVAQSIEGVTHGLVIEAEGDDEIARYADELRRMLSAYLRSR